jgi:hypothetical protein
MKRTAQENQEKKNKNNSWLSRKLFSDAMHKVSEYVATNDLARFMSVDTNTYQEMRDEVIIRKQLDHQSENIKQLANYYPFPSKLGPCLNAWGFCLVSDSNEKVDDVLLFRVTWRNPLHPRVHTAWPTPGGIWMYSAQRRGPHQETIQKIETPAFTMDWHWTEYSPWDFVIFNAISILISKGYSIHSSHYFWDNWDSRVE